MSDAGSGARRQVAVIGAGGATEGSETWRLAEEVGRRLAEAGAIVVCGGRGGVMAAVRVAALFGVLHFLLGTLIFFVIGVGTLFIGFLLAFLTRWLVSAILLKLVSAMSSSLHVVSLGRAFLAAMLMSAIGTAAEAVLLRWR